PRPPREMDSARSWNSASNAASAGPPSTIWVGSRSAPKAPPATTTTPAVPITAVRPARLGSCRRRRGTCRRGAELLRAPTILHLAPSGPAAPDHDTSSVRKRDPRHTEHVRCVSNPVLLVSSQAPRARHVGLGPRLPWRCARVAGPYHRYPALRGEPGGG